MASVPYRSGPPYAREIYNYTLPDEFLCDSPRSGHSRVYSHGDHPSRSYFVNPQQIMNIASYSPDYPDPDPISPPPYSRVSHIGSRSPPHYSEIDHGNRSVHGSWHSQNSKTSSMERSPSHRTPYPVMSPYSPYRTSLPTPPLSPTSKIAAGPSYSTSRKPKPEIIPQRTTTVSSSRFYCAHPACLDNGQPTRSFSRRADLQRHEKSTHEQAVLLSCPRTNCSRKGDNGFSRQDHLIEHRRGYHGESIPKRGSRGGSSGSTSSTRRR